MTAPVHVDGLSKTYDPTPIWMRALFRSPVSEPVVELEETTFSVPEGSVLVVVGQNGAGTSTIIRVLPGLATPSSGTVRVAGFGPTTQGPSVRRVVGFMSADDHTLLLKHSCYENLDFHGRLQGMVPRQRHQRIDDELGLVKLTSRTAPRRHTTDTAPASVASAT